MIFVTSVHDVLSVWGTKSMGGNIRGSLMFSCTTVASIWLSGLGGMVIIDVDASTAQPSFWTYASNSAPVFVKMSLSNDTPRRPFTLQIKV